MTKRFVTQLVDDLDGGEAKESVTFGLDGNQYEIDLSAAHAKALRKTLDNYVSHARKAAGGQPKRRRVREAGPFREVDWSAVRAWAASNGIKVSTRGRVATSVVEQYRAAGN